MHDSTVPDASFFLGNGSHLDQLIRQYDWSKTSLGALPDWPAHLRSTTAMMLRSAVPMSLQWGREGWMIYNDAYRAIAGARHPGMLGKTLLENWPEVAEFRQRALNRVLDGETLQYRNHRLPLIHNGEPQDMYLDLDYSPVVDESGKPAGMLGIINNVTERFQNQERLRIAQEAGRIGTFELFPETGRLEVSLEYRRIWGIAPDVPVTLDLLARLVHPDDRHVVGPQRLGMSNRLAYVEYRRIDPVSGEIRWIARRGEVISTEGRPDRFIGIILDITERKRAEDALLVSEKKWRQLVEQMNVKEVRHRNVRALLQQLGNDAEKSGRRSGGMMMLAEMLQKSVAQVSRFASENPVTQIGDRIARQIEEAFGKDHGWLDHAQWQTDSESMQA
ncbi:PAS domain-containing protein [Rhodanobacter sp. L36]|uniref:PAS domain-containing protein n=1 Tax=Rhodanobacter sp. L36 TaxID=1747221 RepID=UPI00131AF60C|nr:PAS domain-containing protein [Rhodanobacter sp. L36]